MRNFVFSYTQIMSLKPLFAQTIFSSYKLIFCYLSIDIEINKPFAFQIHHKHVLQAIWNLYNLGDSYFPSIRNSWGQKNREDLG